MINQNRPNAFRAIWDLFLSTLSSFFKPRHPVFVINNHPYQVISNLGQGGFSVVYLCKHKDQIHAVKRIRLSDSDEHRVQSEVDILTNIKHENIMNLIEAQILHDEAFLVCEFYAGKSVRFAAPCFSRKSNVREKGTRLDFKNNRQDRNTHRHY